MRTGRSRAVFAGCAALFAIGIAIGLWAANGDPAPPPGADTDAAPEPPDPAAAPAFANAPSGVVAPLSTPGDERRLAMGARLEGVALGLPRNPLAKWWVCLDPDPSVLRRQRLPQPSGIPLEAQAATLTDDKGRFSFVDVRPGRYTVALFGVADSERVVELEAGARCDVELRLGLCQARIELRRHGELAEDLSLQLAANDGTSFDVWRADHPSVWTSLLPAGTHSARIHDARGVLVSGNRTVFVPAGGGGIGIRIDVGTTLFEGIVDDGTTLPLALLSFEAVAVPTPGASPDPEAGRKVFGSADGRTASGEIPPGTWSVTVHSPRLLPAPPQTVTVAEGQPNARVVFTTPRSGFVRLTLRTLDGALLPLGQWPDQVLGQMPAMTERGELQCADMRRWLQTQGPSPCIVRVPGGMTTFRWEDRVVDGELAYLPFEPPPPRTMEVLVQGENPLELRVQARARVTIVACDAGGTEQKRASVAVFAGNQRVQRMSDDPKRGPASRWSSFLPPGEYRAVIEHAGETREHTILVGRENLRLLLKP
jgi:hypothetical protein